MAARRGKSQARRNPSNGIPGWAWLIAGVLLGIVVLLAAPRFLKSDAADDFFRPKPNPDARPAANASAEDDDAIVPESAATAADDGKPKETQYDFYTVLPGKEVAMSDAELAASARAEAERAARTEREQTPAATTQPPQTAPVATATPNSAPPAATATTPPAAVAAADARYILQAGAFGASGDAEAVKAKIALLGLSARVESAQINGKTVYRVRMGPYGTASELAEAKLKLSTGGLPALAIKAQ